MSVYPSSAGASFPQPHGEYGHNESPTYASPTTSNYGSSYDYTSPAHAASPSPSSPYGSSAPSTSRYNPSASSPNLSRTSSQYSTPAPGAREWEGESGESTDEEGGRYVKSPFERAWRSADGIGFFFFFLPYFFFDFTVLRWTCWTIRDSAATTAYSIGSASALCTDGFTRLDSTRLSTSSTGPAGRFMPCTTFMFLVVSTASAPRPRPGLDTSTSRNDLEFIAFFGHDMHDVTIFRSFSTLSNPMHASTGDGWPSAAAGVD
jgi:hypothetical protein